MSNMLRGRRNSSHLAAAENQLELRANTLLDLGPQQLQKYANLDKEYFNKLSSSGIPGLDSGYPANQISGSRIIRKYGIKPNDVTNEFFHRRHFLSSTLKSSTRRRRSVELVNLTSRIAEGMEDKRPVVNKFVERLLERSHTQQPKQTSFTQYRTGNPVGHVLNTRDTQFLDRVRAGDPLLQPLPQIQNKEQRVQGLMNSFSKRSKKWPWMLQKYIQKQKNLQASKRIKETEAMHTPPPTITGNNVSGFLSDDLTDSDFQNMRGDLREGRNDSVCTGEESETNIDSDGSDSGVDRKNVVYKHRYAGSRRSVTTGELKKPFRQKKSNKEDSDQLFSTAKISRKQEKAGRRSRIGLHIQSVDHDTPPRSIPSNPTTSKLHGPSSYRLRFEYGKNLEKNWFNEVMVKRERSGTSNNSPKKFDLRLDLFYSPEPESDDDPAEKDVETDTDGNESASMKVGYSTLNTYARPRRQSKRRSTFKSSMGRCSGFSSVKTPIELEEQNDSTESDIEIVFTNGELVQRKTKQRMRKKRQRQKARYKTFMPEIIKPIKPEIVMPAPLTDHEIRALRLNLKKKTPPKKLKGKRAFRQAANAIFAALRFRKLLFKIRAEKRKRELMRKKRLLKLQNKRKKKKVTWKERVEESVTYKEDKPKGRMGLREKFMAEIGKRLIREIGRLSLKPNDSCSDSEKDDNEANLSQCDDDLIEQTREWRPTLPSKFQTEVATVCLDDVKFIHSGPAFTRSWRSNSYPRLVKLEEFCFEVPDKPKTKRRDRSKSRQRNEGNRNTRGRPKSPEKPKCTCFRNRHTSASRFAWSRSISRPRCCHNGSPTPKMKTVVVKTTGLKRTRSVDDLDFENLQEIDLHDLLRGIDIPAKSIRIEIIMRKMRRQRKRKNIIRCSPVLPAAICRTRDTEEENDSASGSDTLDEDDSDSDILSYGCPFVYSGVAWNRNSREDRVRTWTADDVDRELERISRLFHEMKECRYLRLDDFNQAVVEKLNNNT